MRRWAVEGPDEQLRTESWFPEFLGAYWEKPILM